MKNFLSTVCVQMVTRTRALYKTTARHLMRMWRLVCAWRHTHPRAFLVTLFLCGAIVGAGAKVIARETIMIGHDDYRVVTR